MDFNYAIEKLKKGYKLAQLEWENGYALGCVEEDDNVWTWSLNDKGELVRHIEEEKPQIWDCTNSDTETLRWVIAKRFKKKYLNKLGFIYDEDSNLYRNMTGVLLKVIKKENKTYKIIFVNSCFTRTNTINFHFIHEFINWSRSQGIVLPIVIQEDCIEEFFKKN